MRPTCLCRLRSWFVAAVIALPALAQSSIQIGQNAPTQALQDLFVRSWYRNQFYLIVHPYPASQVRRIGAAGLVQLFEDAGRTPRVRHALIKADANQPVYVPSTGPAIGDVFQVHPGVWTALTTLNNVDPTNPPNLNTTGFPNRDSSFCPPVDEVGCRYSTTDRNYAIFAFEQPLNIFEGQSTYVKDPFFTKWRSIGGVDGPGPAITAEQTLTSSVSTVTATVQAFLKGQLFNITSGPFTGRLFSVVPPVSEFYNANGGSGGFMGFPTSDDLLLANGRRRQSFEGGAVEYGPDTQPILVLPVASVLITNVTNPLRLSTGDSASAKVVLLAPNNTELPDRAVNWLTSNGRVVSVEPREGGAVLRALAGGTATVTAVSEGKSSMPLVIYVDAPCCQPGDGSPTASIRQAFEDAIGRNSLAVRIPTSSPVRRLGSGYWQEFQTTAPVPERIVVAVPDAAPIGFVLRGSLLARYESLQGPIGELGYPTSDATAGGRQMFQGTNALAGRPVRRVFGLLLNRWAAGGYETGELGSPTSDAVPATSFSGSTGFAQTFEKGAILAPVAGPLAGRTTAVFGSFLQSYTALHGPDGDLGFPIAEESVSNGRRRQEFEGAFLEQPVPAGEVAVIVKERQPSVSATPNPVNAGGRVRLAFGGFPAGAAVRVASTGKPDFTVTPASGSFSWPVLVPATARSETITVRATTIDGRVAAETTYGVRSLLEARVSLVKVRGDNQIGVPGGTLPQPLRVSLRDAAGHPLPGVPVIFEASPGGVISPSSALTNESGEAEASLRLPSREGVVLATAAVSGRVVTFSARMASTQLANFPAFRQDLSEPLGNGTASIADRGALLAGIASIVRYYQDRGEVPSPNGLATVSLLNEFLKGYCVQSVQSLPICDGFLAPVSGLQIVNLQRVPVFAGSSFLFKPLMLSGIADALSMGDPVLLALDMTRDGAPAGSHFVVATGVSETGVLQIHDPAPWFQQVALPGLLGPLNLNGAVWKGQVASAVILVPGASPTGGFLIHGDTDMTVSSPAGPCGDRYRWLDLPVAPFAALSPAPVAFYQGVCTGGESAYQLDTASERSYRLTITDLANPGRVTEAQGFGAGAYSVTWSGTWIVEAQSLGMAARSITSAAAVEVGLAPGALASIWGLGLSGRSVATMIEVDEQLVVPVAVSPFRLTIFLPGHLSTGEHTMRVRSQFGEAATTIHLAAAAPALFVRPDGWAVAFNVDGDRTSANGPLAPVLRGSQLRVSVSGLGAMTSTGPATPVRAFLGGREAIVNSTELDPSSPGLYWIRITVPPDLPPAERVKLLLTQASSVSNQADVAVE